MANHLNNSQIQTILALTVTNITPTQLFQLVDALNRVKYTLSNESANGANDSNLGTIFPAAGPNP